MESLTTKKSRVSKIYLFLLCLIGFTAPFWHIFLNVRGMEGYLGYKYMSSFLFAIGNRLCLLVVSLLFLTASNLITNEFKKTFKIISYTSLFISCFFLVQIFISKKTLVEWSGTKDLPKWVYYFSMSICGILSVVIFSYFQKAINWGESKFIKIIHVLFKGYYEDLERENLINPWKKKEYDEFVLEITDKVTEHEQK